MNSNDAPSLRESEGPMHSLTAVLGALYAHEINCGLSSFWDGGWSVWIGDEMNGRRAEADIERGDHHLIGQWLAEAASDLFPSADFPWARRKASLYRLEHTRATPSRAFLQPVPASAQPGDDGSSPQSNEAV